MINKTLLVILLIVALLLFSTWLFADIFMYLCTSIVLAAILRPLTNMISKTYIFRVKLTRVLAIFVSYGVVISVFSFFVLLFIPLILEQVNVLSDVSFDDAYERLSAPVVSLENFLSKYDLINKDENNLTKTIKLNVFKVINNLNFSGIINDFLTITGSFLISIMAVSFITFFLLYEKSILTRLMISSVPNQYFELFISAIHKIEHLLSNFLIGLLLQMVAIFSIVGIGLSLFGIKYALTIAVFAAVANLIPYLGPLLGAIFATVVGLSTSGNFAFDQTTVFLLLKITSVFALVQVVDNVVLQPFIFSKSVKAHPLEIFIVIFAAASLGGIVGMVVAIPAYTVIRVSVTEIQAGFASYRIFQSLK